MLLPILIDFFCVCFIFLTFDRVKTSENTFYRHCVCFYLIFVVLVYFIFMPVLNLQLCNIILLISLIFYISLGSLDACLAIFSSIYKTKNSFDSQIHENCFFFAFLYSIFLYFSPFTVIVCE